MMPSLLDRRSVTEIRVAQHADLPRLVEMGRAFLGGSSYRADYLENPEQMGRFAARLIDDPNGDVLVVSRNDALVGMIGLIAFDHFISGTRIAGEAFYWVDPSARGRGIVLLRAAEDWARRQGALALQMIAPTPRVERFYEALGYHAVERLFQKTL